MNYPATGQPIIVIWRRAREEDAPPYDASALLCAHGGDAAQTTAGDPLAIFARGGDAGRAVLALARAAHAAGDPIAIAAHAGACSIADGVAVGTAAGRAQALLRASRAPQILLSHTAAEEIAEALPADCELAPLGSQRLLDLLPPQPLFELREPGLPSAGAIAALDTFPHNLPLQPTPFVGRGRDVGEVCDLLSAGETRLLTLVATSGTGKTRFSLEVAARLIERYPDGVTFVALAAVNDPQLVLTQIARALGVRETSARPLLGELSDYLRERRALLILDNFEQVLASASVVAELIAEARWLQTIVTSHVPLRVAGERVRYIPPMDLPNPEQPTTLADLVRYDAVALFIERAQAVAPGFALDDANQAQVASLTARLGGLPLAIDLAAATVDQLDLATLLRELGDYKLGAMPLPMVLDWAYRRLPPATRQVFGRLGVFAGGCTFDVAEQICRIGNERLDVTQQLQLLMRRNLLFPEELRAGMVRYIMLDTVHDLARRYLVDQEEVEVLARRHNAFYVDLARQGYAGLHSEQQPDWLLRIESEQHNMRQAFQWAMNNRSHETAGQFVAALGRYWHLRGAFSEGQRWIDAVLPHCSVLSAPVQAQVLNVATIIYGEQGFYDRAESMVHRALQLHRTHGDREGEYHALNNLGVLSVFQMRFDDAAGYYQRGLELARSIGSARLHALALNNLGDLAMERGDYPSAAGYLLDALELARHSGDLFRAVDLLNSLGWAMLAAGDHDQARAHFSEGLAACRDMRSDANLPELLEGAAGVLCGADAARMLGAAEALREESGRPLPEVYRERIEPILRATHGSLDPGQLSRAWTEGRAMGAAQAIASALRQLAAEPVPAG